MAQNRTHDYRGPRSSENLNRHLVDLLPPGVYRGLFVHTDALVDPGVLITAQGVRIEETATVEMSCPMGHATLPRIDLVVCTHEYPDPPTYPAEPAVFHVVTGEANADPQPPAIPDHSILIATCRMEPGADEWSSVTQACPPARVVNAVQLADQSWEIVKGELSAMMEQFDPNTGMLSIWMTEYGALNDGDPIVWGDPVLSMSFEGIVQLNAHIYEGTEAHVASAIALVDTANRFTAEEVETALAELAGADRTTETVKGLDTAKLDKSGGTVSGDLTLQGKVSFDADDVGDVAFDDYVTFEHSFSPAEAHSEEVGGEAAWTYQPDYDAWVCADVVNPLLFCYLVASIKGIKDAELVSLKIFLQMPPGDDADDIRFMVLRGYKNGTAWDIETLADSSGNTAPANELTQFTLILGTPKAMAGSDVFTLKILGKVALLQFRGFSCVYRRKKVVV